VKAATAITGLLRKLQMESFKQRWVNDRPDSGDAIGQEAPLGDGLYILIAGCIVLGTIKILKREIESYFDKQ